MTVSSSPQALRIHAISTAADDVFIFDLRSSSKSELSPFEPGAHINLHLPEGIVRSYSLLNDARERHRYVLAIKREPAGRGGSAWMHDQARVGGSIPVSGPTNDFALVETAAHSVLVAGGIGITPLWCMAQQLAARGRSWELHYRAQRRASAALLDELDRPGFREHVHLSFSDECQTGRPDLSALVGGAPQGTHFYCCGPNPMIDAFRGACRDVPPDRVHAEHFAAAQAPATEGGYMVRLARSDRVLPVLPGQSILATLKANGLQALSACQQGVCGECEVKVLAGTPDHRDLVLTPQERESGRTMMICCSGSLSPELTLDL